MQAYIAGELAARAAEALDDTEIERLQRIQARLEAAARKRDAEQVDRLNHEIHLTINRSSRSSRMTSLLALTVHYVPLGFFGTRGGGGRVVLYGGDRAGGAGSGGCGRRRRDRLKGRRRPGPPPW